ncbi:polysaccharide pyruvyl transferase family protein (plasmid) [Sinorhizobium meliloti]|nr:polysaccharide pyruvyl transferase family protein [Sinorhizobium meliloti]
MAKLGVLTFHRCINYGSFWQARSLVHGLRSLGTDPIVLDHHSARVTRAEWRCAMQPLLPERTPRGDIPLYASKIRKFQSALASVPMSAPFALDDPDGAEECDIVVVGSDEVWNLRHPWYGGCSLFYGEGLSAKRTVSYAATFGNHPAANGLEPYWAERLRKFDGISVRDDNSRAIIEKDVGREATLVLDPCLQFPETISFGPNTLVSRPYIAVYGHSFPSWFQHAVRHWATTRSLPLVSIGYRNEWADEQWLDAGPYEFAACIAGAEAVATNFFHGCIFLSSTPSHSSRSFPTIVPTRSPISHTPPVRNGTWCRRRRRKPATRHFSQKPPSPAIARRLAELRRQSRTYLTDVLA